LDLQLGLYFTVIFIYYNVYWCQGCGVSTFCQTNIWWWWWWYDDSRL